jgi:cytochrome c-type biogenesis protein CcmH
MWRKSAPSLLGLLAAASLVAAPVRLAAQAVGSPAAPNQDSAAIANGIRMQARDSLGRLEYPEAAGRAMGPVTARDNEVLVKDIEQKIRCTCGCNLSVYTCRTTDFSCTTSPAMHRLVLARLDSGMTEAEVLASFERQYGEMIFMEPPKRGFNWAAYVMPFIGLGVGIGLVLGIVRRWAHAAPKPEGSGATAAAGEPVPGVSPEEMEKLKRELERFEA